jgi:hypothetical protein
MDDFTSGFFAVKYGKYGCDKKARKNKAIENFVNISVSLTVVCTGFEPKYMADITRRCEDNVFNLRVLKTIFYIMIVKPSRHRRKAECRSRLLKEYTCLIIIYDLYFFISVLSSRTINAAVKFRSSPIINAKNSPIEDNTGAKNVVFPGTLVTSLKSRN